MINPLALFRLFLAVVILALFFPGCSWLKKEGKAAAGAVVDCTTSEAKSQISTFSPLLQAAILFATGSDGKVDGNQLESATSGFVKDIGGCVAAHAVQAMLATPKPVPGSPQSSPVYVDANSLGLWWEQKRAKLGGATYKLAGAS